MLITGQNISSYPRVKKEFKPKKAIFFGNQPVKEERRDYKARIPDPIYNFFFGLPKYELHAHFNGSTPLNISKLFLNKENRFIGTSQDDLEDKYNDIRKKSTSLADWLQKTYELKAKNITTMDITSASYAIAMEEAKQNCRYLEVRIDPYSSSFVGSPEDVLRATEAGLRNAREDLKEMGKEMKTGIILLAERHAPPENSFRTAKLATKLRSQRVQYEQMLEEMRQAHQDDKVYDYSQKLSRSYVELMNVKKVVRTINNLTDEVYSAQQPDRLAIQESLQRVHFLLNNNLEARKEMEVPLANIEKLHKIVATTKTKTISTMDLVPVVYSTVLSQVKKEGKKKVVISIDPFDKLYDGKPEDILRAVQVGLRNAAKDVESTHGNINASIIIEIDTSKLNPQEAKEAARLVVTMKSQRVLFDKMYAEMKSIVKSGKPYNHSVILDKLVADLSLTNKIKQKLIKTLSSADATTEEATRVIKAIIDQDVSEFNTQTAKLKTRKVLFDVIEMIGEKGFDEKTRNELLPKISASYSQVEGYISDKALIAKKLFDNLRHVSTLKLTDEADGTKIADRYLRMGTGVIPNVAGLCVEAGSEDATEENYTDAYNYIRSYNRRKPDAREKVKFYTDCTRDFTSLEDVINNPGEAVGNVLQVTIKDKNSETDSFDESSIHTVYSKDKISSDVQALSKLVTDDSNPDTYVKLESTRALKELADKLKTQYNMHEQKFLLRKRIFDDLHHFSKLTIKDKHEGTRDAIRFVRMGVDITPNVVGYDIAGNENEYPLNLHDKAMHHIKYYNEQKSNPDEELKVTIHAGEVKKSGKTEESKIPGWKNIEEAVTMGAHRIGHGIDLRNAPESLKTEVRRRNVLMETCPKVNFQTKAVEGYRNHPILDFLDEDIPANINTDNPVTAGTNLTNEYVKVFKRFNYNITPEERQQGIKERFTLGHIKKMIHNAIWSSFGLTAQEKAAEEEYAMARVNDLVEKYGDKVVLKDNEPIMLKVQKGVVAFTGSLKKAIAKQLKQDKVA